MKITGHFKDRNNDTITVVIYNMYVTAEDINIDTSDDIRFSDDPVTIYSECEDSFVHIIKTNCKISLVSRIWLGDYLFANNAESIVVNVKRTHGNTDTVLFAGYVTPNTFSQDFANEWETLEINCIDYLGVLEYKYPTDETTFEELRANVGSRSFIYLMEKMKLNNTQMIISNLPITTDASEWVETGYTVDINGDIYVIESDVAIIDSYSSVKTGEERTGNKLNPTWMQSSETFIDTDGQLYYKEYAWVTINGTLTQTTQWRKGAAAPMPYVVGFEYTLIGWTYGPMPNWFMYYDYYRQDNVMSDDRVKVGESDMIGEMIPEYPNTTSEGSYYEMRQGDATDLYYDEDEQEWYYKDYAWIVQTINGETVEDNTGNWVKGQQTAPI